MNEQRLKLNLITLIALIFINHISVAEEPPLFKAQGLDEVYAKMSAFQKRSADLMKGQEKTSVEFGFMTLNAGMLKAWYSSVPEYDQRSPLFPAALTAKIKELDLDFISLQEEWYGKDYDRLQKAIDALNKETGKQYSAERINLDVQTKTGLVLIINKNRYSLPPAAEIYFEQFLTPDGKPIASGLESAAGFQRGLLFVIFTTKNSYGQEVRFLVGNTHLTATVGEGKTRADQIAAAQKTIRWAIEQKKIDFYALGCDFNFSPEFALALPNEQQAWQQNAEVYVQAFNELSFVDAFRVLHPLTETVGWTWDKRSNHLIRGGSASIKDEPLQRTDPILVGTSKASPSDDAFVVTKSGLLFDVPPNKPISDHYGVYARVRFLKR